MRSRPCVCRYNVRAIQYNGGHEVSVCLLKDEGACNVCTQ